MRRLSWRFAGLLVAVTLLLGACSRDDGTDATGRSGLPSRSIEAGEVTVKITPDGIDADGAVFDITFDTHSVELDVDVAANAFLVVDGKAWTDATWEGPGVGGHHRDGTLRFAAAGDPVGTADLTIDGLPEPVRATWTLGEP